MKLVKSKDFQVRETTKTFYQDEKDTLVNNIDFNNLEMKQIEFFEPMTKEIVKELWNERNLTLKKEKILLEISKLKYLKKDAFKDRIDKSKSINNLDIIIADIILYTEEYVSEYNKKELEKANPLSYVK